MISVLMLLALLPSPLHAQQVEESAMRSAMRAGRTAEVAGLLDEGHPIENEGGPGRRGTSDLSFAVWAGYDDIVRLLLDHEASLDGATFYPWSNCRTDTLHAATAGGDVGILQMLLEAGADPARRDVSGYSPLEIAAVSGSPEVLEALLDAGAPVEHEGERALLPVGLAAMVGDSVGAALLAERGAPVSFHAACALGWEALVAEGLAEEAELAGHVGELQALTPLQLAAVFGHVGVARLLLDAGAPIDQVARPEQPRLFVLCGEEGAGNVQSNATALAIAAARGQAEFVRLLLERGAAPEGAEPTTSGPLRRAIGGGSAACVAALLEAGADAERKGSAGWTPARHAEKKLDRDVLVLLHATGSSLSFPALCSLGDLELVTLQAPAGESSRQYARAADSPMHVAAIFGDALLVERLSELGYGSSPRDARRGTPLHSAARHDRPEALEALIGLGADIEARDATGGSPLHRAAMAGSTRVVRELLRLGAELDARDNYERTSLHEASLWGRDEVVAELLRAGAALDLRDQWGATPLLLAEGNTLLRTKLPKERQPGRRRAAMQLREQGGER